MKKNNILLDGIIASMGILFAKIITLLYISPYYSILETTENIGFYANVYNIYAYILNVATVGLPFAIATLTAKYLAKKDYNSCLKVKRISILLMSFVGFVSMTTLVVLSKMIATQITLASENVSIMQNLLLLISPALLFIPILSSERGFFQGIKKVDLYSKSQVFEQFIRIIFLLTLSFVLVRVFNMNSIWALYMGVVSTSISGILAIIYIKVKGNASLNEIKLVSKSQKGTTANNKFFIKELIALAFPYLIISIFGYSDVLINQIDFVPGLETYGIVDKNVIELFREAIFAKANKLIAIPMILGQGLSISIIPHITEAITKVDFNKVKENIFTCIESALYITIPLCVCLALFAKPVLFVLFGDVDERLDLGVVILQMFTIEAFFTSISSVLSSIMMAVRKRRKIILYTIIFALIKVLLNRYLIGQIGVFGMILSSSIGFIVINYLNIYCLYKTYNLNLKHLIKSCIYITIACIGMILVYSIVNGMIHFESRVLALLLLLIAATLCILSYFLITWLLKMPQKLFKIKSYSTKH